MKKFLLCLFVAMALWHCHTTNVHASSVKPQPPFSEEGNPEEDYYFSTLFPLFGYIRAPALEIYENQERTRNYMDIEVCGGAEHDRRDYYCNDQGDKCDGGDVDMCKRGTNDVELVKHSSNGKCKLERPGPNQDSSGLIDGRCEYTQIPSVQRDIKGTDFSTTDQTTYKKIQDKSGAYNNVGTDNAITWGSQHLSLDMGQKVINQLLVVKRAKQTKNTVRETGEWPLGWVDWGYVTPNGKTLFEIANELPDGVSAAGTSIVEAADDFFLNAGNLDAVSNVSKQKEYVITAVAYAASQTPEPEWVKDLLQAPLYSPSWRQSYVRPSICVWDICRPGTRGDAPQPKGTKRALYYDNSISQAFGAALDNLFATYPLEEGVSIFNELSVQNPLIRFTTSAAPNAIPSEIKKRLNEELKNPCLEYTKGMTWLSWGNYMDYVDPNDYFDPQKKCHAWQLAPEMSKQNAAAFFQSPLSALIAMIWGQKQDQVDSVVHHMLTVPDAMGQSIQEIQQPVYNARDTLAELELVKDFNAKLSNTVDDNADYLLSGETPFTAPRYLGLYPCADDMFSSQLDTSIKEYAEGARVGCNQKSNTTTTGKCDGTKFAKIIADSPWKAPTTTATQVVLNSAMFVGGKLNPKLEEVYAKAEAETGVPCEVLAGLHFEEGSASFTDHGNPETVSVSNGGAANRDGGLEASALTAAHSILRHPITNTAKLIAAYSSFNGGGNANCQFNITVPYPGCPRQFIGEDDPYVTHMLDAKHMNMYQIYCDDFKTCNPFPKYDSQRPGAFAVALAVYNEATSKNIPPSGSPSPSTSSIADYGKAPSTGTSLNPTGDCGDGYIDTALGCLPYERTEFIMTLLRFLVGLAGSIALVIMLIATIQIMTAAGDAKKLQSGRDLFFSAVTGLLFLIFSVSLLRIFGADILKLPGF
jgi:hypothetical protein